jgi:MFS family permease
MDVPGMALYVAAVFLIMFGFASLGTAWYYSIVVAAGLACAVYFVFHEAKEADPLIDVRMLKRNKNFLYSNIASMLNYAATFAVSYLLSIYLQVVQGYNAQTAGLLLIIQPFTQAVFSPVAGRMSDKRSPFMLATIGMGICTLSLIIYLFYGVNSPLVLIIANMLLIGFGFGIFSSPNTNAIMSSVGSADYSFASAFMSTARNIGQITSMTIITLVMSAMLGNLTFAQAPKEAIVHTMRVEFIVFIALSLLGIFCAVQRRERRE